MYKNYKNFTFIKKTLQGKRYSFYVKSEYVDILEKYIAQSGPKKFSANICALIAQTIEKEGDNDEKKENQE